MKIALRSRTKLGFVDGLCKKLESNSPMYEQWIHYDSMVVSWLLNSIVPKLSEAFLCTGYVEELWLELLEIFGQSNGPLIYQV